MQTPQIENVRAQVSAALAEDVGSGDVTARLIDPGAWGEASVITRESAVICGRAWFDEVFAQTDERVTVKWRIDEGARVEENTVICELFGPARALLTGERTALNFLQLLSGTATAARACADAVAGTGAVILDTRKTIPGWRYAQKYAVVCGGCRNHRMGLYDAVLIKENHIAAAGSIAAAIAAARKLAPDVPVEVEVENLDQLVEAVAAAPERIMLDNFTLADLRSAVQRVAEKVPLEASGGIDLTNVRAVAETGVNFISIGGMTKHVRAVDLSMRLK